MPTAPPAGEAATALAGVLGAHALALFAVLLAVLLVAVTLLAWSADHMARRRAGRPRHPWVRLGLGVGLGFALIVGAATVFAELAEEVVEGGAPQRLDQVFMDAVQQHTAPSVRDFFGAVTRLGDPPTLAALAVLVTLALWWRGRQVLAIAYVAAVGGNALLNPALKRVFERVRPLDAQGLPLADGFSFPRRARRPSRSARAACSCRRTSRPTWWPASPRAAPGSSPASSAPSLRWAGSAGDARRIDAPRNKGVGSREVVPPMTYDAPVRPSG